MADSHHGSTPAAWTAVVLVLIAWRVVGATLVGIAFVIPSFLMVVAIAGG